jgi:hypothetical protein
LLAMAGAEPLPASVDRRELTDLMNWSWASFNAMTDVSRSITPFATSLSFPVEVNHHPLDQ